MNNLKNSITSFFPHKETPEQLDLIDKLCDYIYSPNKQSLFILKGYAGTGKTLIVSSLVKSLHVAGCKSVLLAPTGRAAKVLSGYASKKAYTIHKKIYRITSSRDVLQVSLQANLHKNTIFIVDESSMIQGNENASSNSNMFSTRNLLDDLVEYVYEGNNCKMILLGDTAQLPPVGSTISTALDVEFLKQSYPLQLETFELQNVVRQEKESGILQNATSLRNNIQKQQIKPPFFNVENFPDIHSIMGQDLEDVLNSAYSNPGPENCTIICRTNKQTNIFNKEIRNRILYKDEEITAGDLMMVVKNNYFWLPKDSTTGFIANGDIIEITKVIRIEELYGFRFADISIRLLDYPDEEELEVKILLNTIDSDTPSLPYEENKKLFSEIMLDYEDINSRAIRMQKIKSNPHFNALQVKFAYALTCHKTQGGQWHTVIINKGYVTAEREDISFLRWLYTAITRATHQVYLVNFEDKYFFNP